LRSLRHDDRAHVALRARRWARPVDQSYYTLYPGAEVIARVASPFERQDFILFYALRFGYRPSKIGFLAWSAWHDASVGPWPDIPAAERHQYDIGAIKSWLGVFVRRFFKEAQFKRSCLPNAPKVGSGGSLSPRADYRAPSDAEATVWLAELELVPDEDVPNPTSQARR
jgi:NAD+ synthase (glutamine-hydrolysing)